MREDLEAAHIAGFPTEWARLVRICARFVPDPATAEDLAQETMLIAWQRADDLRDPAARSAWPTRHRTQTVPYVGAATGARRGTNRTRTRRILWLRVAR